MSELFNINRVCKLLNTTSRTLRFYEQQGIIQSTYVEGTIQRQYTQLQIEHIKNVFVLRSLGLSVSSIKKLLCNNIDLGSAIKEKRAAVIAQIATKTQELRVLEEALCVIDNGGDVFTINTTLPYNNPKTVISEIAAKCTDYLLSNNLNQCYEHFSKKLAEYLPVNVLEKVQADTIEQLGDYISLEKTETDDNIVYHYLRYEKLGLKVKYVFNDGCISGFWTDYYEKI